MKALNLSTRKGNRFATQVTSWHSTNSEPQQSYEEMFMQVTEPPKVGDQLFNSLIGQLPGCTPFLQRQGEISSLLARADVYILDLKEKARTFIYHPLTSALEAIVSWRVRV
jgi:hypothetical protein